MALRDRPVGRLAVAQEGPPHGPEEVPTLLADHHHELRTTGLGLKAISQSLPGFSCPSHIGPGSMLA